MKCKQAGCSADVKGMKQHLKRMHGVGGQVPETPFATSAFSGLRGELGRLEDLAKTNPKKADALYNNYIKGRQSPQLRRHYTKPGGNPVWVQLPDETELI